MEELVYLFIYVRVSNYIKFSKAKEIKSKKCKKMYNLIAFLQSKCKATIYEKQ